MKIAVLSDGGWGSSLALLLVDNKHEVWQWGPFEDYIDEMKESRRNERFLKGAVLPDELKLTANMAEAVEGAEIVLMASPTQYARGTIEQLAKAGLKKEQILLNVAKGIEMDTLKRISEIVDDYIDDVNYVALSGPSHAEEVFRKVPTLVVVAAENIESAEKVQRAFNNENFRVYTSVDVIGVELGGALKNVLAIAAGICDGMELGDNAKAALLTRGVSEMARFGEMLGGQAETFSGLSGLGDIIVTCTSGHSRNRHVGEELGRGKKLDEIIKDMGMVVAEGVATAKSAYELSQKIKLNVPIFQEVYLSLYEGKDPRVAVRDLMTRDVRSEHR